MFKIMQWVMVGLATVMISGCSGGGSDCENGDAISYQGIDYCEVTSPYTGEVWLDRNLGASQVCTAYNDTACYGDYYQWGRKADGHEKSDSPVTNVQATEIDNVGHGNFIESNSTYLDDWAQEEDGDGSQRLVNWSKTDGSFICPVGYRVPTIDELKAELFDSDSAEIQKDSGDKVGNSDDRRVNAVNSFLKLASVGYRDSSSSSMEDVDEWGGLWASSPNDGSYSSYIGFYSADANWGRYTGRANGLSVRCLKD